MTRLPRRRVREPMMPERATQREFPRHRKFIRSLECVCANISTLIRDAPGYWQNVWCGGRIRMLPFAARFARSDERKTARLVLLSGVCDAPPASPPRRRIDVSDCLRARPSRYRPWPGASVARPGHAQDHAREGDTVTEDDLRAIEARTEAATPGDWRVRKGEGLWWSVEVELPSINGLPCWYTIARFDFDMAANGYTDGALKPEADAALVANAKRDIRRLAAALREAWERVAEMTADVSTLDRVVGYLCIADTDIDPVAQITAMAEAGAASEARALAAEADCKRLQDEAANLDAARREAEADLAGERGEYQRHSQGHMDRALAAEAAAAAMREALAGLLKHYMRIADSGDCGFWNPEEEPVVQAARAALKETSNG